MQTLVTLREITCDSQFGQINSDPINLKIEYGDRIILSGVSGVGKSTLLCLIAGLVQPTSGTIAYDGKQISNTRQDIMLISQFPKALPFSFAYNVTFRRSLNHEELDILRSIINLLGLFPSEELTDEFLLERRLSGLSGGELYRLGLARAFWHKPSLLLLDEPTASLNHDLSLRVLKALTSSFPTLLISSHDELVNSFCNNQLILHYSHV